MKNDTLKYLLILLLTGTMLSGFGQEFNYWMNGVDSRSSMLSGAVTAGVNDNSAIYYNPAGLAYVENSSLSFSSNGYFLSALDITNGAGEGLDLKSTMVDGFSQIFSFVQKVPELPISLTFAIINRHNTKIRTSIKNDIGYDVIPSLAGDEFFIGTYRYYNKIKEDWGGFGYGKKVGPNLGLGISTFITYRNQSYFKSQSADVYPGDGGILFAPLATSGLEEELGYKNFGWLFILGASWQYNKLKFGLAVTTPRINIGFASKSDFKRVVEIDNEVSDTLDYKVTTWRSKVKSVYKSPLIIDIGIEYPLTKNTSLYGKISVFSRIRKYAILPNLSKDDDLPEFIDERINGFTNMMLAQKSVVNLAIAVQHHFSDKFEFIGGFRTDFNPLDRNEINVFDGNYPGITYWNIYHLTTGVVWRLEKFELSIGGDYAFGFHKNTLQFVNLSEPTDENFLFGVPNNTANAMYNQINISLGLVYFFRKI
ncbi:MAG: hypothetical protein B6I19_11255 [Bacteroidetes bacterium 4572_114]|nr:MAG: hypothetical protein B6I19_11255 [Bacteroidetes bacterium 4572_114]